MTNMGRGRGGQEEVDTISQLFTPLAQSSSTGRMSIHLHRQEVSLCYTRFILSLLCMGCHNGNLTYIYVYKIYICSFSKVYDLLL